MKLLNRALVLNIGILGAGLSQLTLLMALSRLASPEALGYIAISGALHALLMLLGDWGLTALSIARNKVCRPSTNQAIALTSLSIVFVFFAINLMIDWRNLTAIAAMFGVSAAFRFANCVGESKLILDEKFREVAIAEAVAYLFGLLATTLLTLQVFDPVLGYAAGITMFFAIRYAVMVRFSSAAIARGPEENVVLADVRDYLVGVQGARAMNYAFNSMETFALRFAGGAAFLGTYSRLSLLNNFLINYFSVFAEKFAFRYLADPAITADARRFIFLRFFPSVFVAAGAYSLCVLNYGYEIIILVLGNRWSAMAGVLLLLSASVPFRIANKFLDTLIKVHGYFRYRILTQGALATAWLSAILGLGSITLVSAAKLHVIASILNVLFTLGILRKEVSAVNVLILPAFLLLSALVLISVALADLSISDRALQV